MFTKFSGRTMPSFKTKEGIYVENHPKYICSICLQEHLYAFAAHQCERSHSCTHELKRYGFYDNYSNEQEKEENDTITLHEICDNCCTYLRRLDIDIDDEKLIKSILDTFTKDT